MAADRKPVSGWSLATAAALLLVGSGCTRGAVELTPGRCSNAWCGDSAEPQGDHEVPGDPPGDPPGDVGGGDDAPPLEEFVVYDGVFSFVEGDHGYHAFPLAPAVPTNWLTPVDFFAGTFEFRAEIMAQPTTTAGRFNVVLRGDTVELCIASADLTFSGPGDVVTLSESPSVMFECPAGGVDFSRPLELSNRQLMMSDTTGCRISDWVSECWDDRAAYLPMEVRLTIIAVGEGATFSGWP